MFLSFEECFLPFNLTFLTESSPEVSPTHVQYTLSFVFDFVFLDLSCKLIYDIFEDEVE